MSVTPIDAELLAQQAEELSDDIEALDNTRAPLWAVYGYNGTWDYERSALLKACANSVRENARGEKVTEAYIDQKAHMHASYLEKLDQAVQDRTTMALLDAEIAGKQRRYELAKERMANFRKASI